MSEHNKHNKHDNEQEQQAAPAEEPEVMDITDTDAEEDTAEAQAEAAEVNLAEELDAARAQIEKDRNDYLFLMADFDNYRKRVTREKADLLKNAAERVLLGLLPIVDDFERGLAATRESTDAADVRKGMELIYSKLVKYLEANGVKAMETNGADFDSDLHEAIATIPAPTPDQKGKIIDTTQKGYMLNDKVLRHAKVAVGE